MYYARRGETEGYRVIICGSRGWGDRLRIADRISSLPGNAVVVNGYARGADRIAHQEAEKAGLVVEPYPAEWDKHDDEILPCSCPPEKKVCKLAGFRRNEKMARLGADLLIAFWDGKSNGTMDMMERAAAHGISIECIHKDFPNRVRTPL